MCCCVAMTQVEWGEGRGEAYLAQKRRQQPDSSGLAVPVSFPPPMFQGRLDSDSLSLSLSLFSCGFVLVHINERLYSKAVSALTHVDR